MSRTRTVYPSDMVCHLWANAHHTDVRTQSGNLYTENGVLFSYGSHFAIAAFMRNPKDGGNLVLWNDANYSITTSKHQSQAFRALPSWVRQDLTRVPTLNAETVRNPEKLAHECIDAAKKPLEKCEKSRQNLGGHFAAARAYFRSAVRLFTYAGNLKAAASVPTLPDFDETNPKGMKAAAADILNRIARADRIQSAKNYAARALGDFNAAQTREHLYIIGGKPTKYEHGAMYAHGSAVSICKAAHDAVIHSDYAIGAYKLAAANVPPNVYRVKKQAAALEQKYTQAASAELLNERRVRVAANKRAALAALANYRRETVRTLSTGARIPVGSARSMLWRIERVENEFPSVHEAADLWPNETERAAQMADFQAIRARINRIAVMHGLASSINSTVETCDKYEREQTSNAYSVPNPTYTREALRKMSAIFGDRMPQYWQAQAAAAIERADTLARGHAERVARLNAEKIERWRSGERVSVPRDLPPMVRIVGQIVETSWGASVPLDHAARLVRIAQRVAANGGAVYENADGPMVGHFRVNRINPDLSAVIGCHTFTADESRRAISLIDAATVATSAQ